jgi:hypothetical protein
MFTMRVPNQDEEKPEEKLVSSRMPASLADEIQSIADETGRSRSKAIVLLLKRGIEAYRKDGILGDFRAFPMSAEEKSRKANPRLSVAPPARQLDYMEQIDELRQISGENIPIDALVLYCKFLKDGDRKFFEMNYPARTQELVIAYKENRLDEYLSDQAPETKTAG